MATSLTSNAGPTSRHVTLAPASAPRTLPKLEPRPAFQLAHHPRQWMADTETGRLLPLLTPITTMSGVNGATDSDPLGAEYPMTRRGYRFLPTDITADMPDGPPSYLVAHDVRGGVCHLSAWETPIPGASATRTDPEGYRAFLAWLVDAGHIEPVEPHVVSAVTSRLERQRRQHARKAGTDPVEAEQAEQLAAEISIWEAALVEPVPEPEPEPTPSPKRRRGRKATTSDEES